MASGRCTAVPARPTEFLDLTSVPRDACQQLLPPFAAAFHAPRAAGRRDGKPRTARPCAVYKPGPRPTPEERRCFLLTSLTTDALQVGQGRLWGLGQRTAKPWMPVLLPALLAALRPRGAAPARALTALAQRIGVAAADAATGGTPLAEAPGPLAPALASPLVPMTGRHGASCAPRTLVHRPRVRAARTQPTRGKMSGVFRPC